jgi:glycosyltransferase involved in cell wall biosynthesis
MQTYAILPRMSEPQISAVITCFNSADTLARCLASVAWADEIVVLDSGSTDASFAIATAAGAHWHVQAFKGYAAQKTDAISLAQHDWILLLDSDEALAEGAVDAIRAAVQSGAALGFRLPRIERVFWRYQHPASHHNTFLRLFDRKSTHISAQLVHETPIVSGPVQPLQTAIWHDSETSIALKLAKLNQYSSLAAAGKPKRFLALRMTLYPLWYFFRAFVLRRQFLHGWAGYIGSVELAHYAFLKHAKQFESKQAQSPYHVAQQINEARKDVQV